MILDRIIFRIKKLNHQSHNNQSTLDNLNKKYDKQESIVEHNTRNLEKQESTFESSYRRSQIDCPIPPSFFEHYYLKLQ
jgi:hypothetical protein